MTTKHKCEKCNALVEFYKAWAEDCYKALAEEYKAWAEKYAEKCQCEKEIIGVVDNLNNERVAELKGEQI